MEPNIMNKIVATIIAIPVGLIVLGHVAPPTQTPAQTVAQAAPVAHVAPAAQPKLIDSENPACQKIPARTTAMQEAMQSYAKDSYALSARATAVTDTTPRSVQRQILKEGEALLAAGRKVVRDGRTILSDFRKVCSPAMQAATAKEMTATAGTLDKLEASINRVAAIAASVRRTTGL
jgi:hypothetical protein